MATLPLAPRETDIITFLADTYTDPLTFTLGAFPWGQGLLAAAPGPDVWQAEAMERIRTYYEDGVGVNRFAFASGNGVGKGALSAMLGLWFLATRPHPQVVVTANTFAQLQTKTWREWAKWLQMSILAPYFTWTGTKCYHNQFAATWYATAQPWNITKPEASAGTHAPSVLMIMDESSAIPDPIWEAIEGAQTTEDTLWVVLGNPTRPTGRFRACFAGGQFAHRWQSSHIDARTARHTNKRQIAEWAQDYGEDSDFFKVHVLGQFPRRAVGFLITEEAWQLARSRPLVPDDGAPLLMGVDVARYGDDRSALVVRRGPELVLVKSVRNFENPRLAGLVVETANDLQHRLGQRCTIFIDGSNLGAVADLVRLSGWRDHVVEVLGNESPLEPHKYYNKAIERWDSMREWLETRAALPQEDAELKADLLLPEYMFDVRTDKLRLESKESMKTRTGLSPDLGDALSFTFSRPVARTDVSPSLRRPLVLPPSTSPLAWMGA